MTLLRLASQDDPTFWEAAAGVGIALIAIIIAWVILRFIIIWVTRGIERGTDLTERQKRKLATYGKEPVAAKEEQDYRLERERRHKRATTIRSVLTSFLTVLAITTFIFVLLGAFGVPVAALLASAGVLSVAVGFGAQSLVKDLISGAFMLMEDQYGVGDIIDVGEATGMGVRILRGEPITFARHDPPGAVVEGDPVQWWHHLADDARSGLSDDTDLDRMVDSPMGPRSVGEGLSFPAVDLFVHGWDLGSATGQSITIPDEAIAFTKMMFDTVPEERSRSAGVFGAARPAPDGATPTEAIIAWTGRDPHWSPAN